MEVVVVEKKSILKDSRESEDTRLPLEEAADLEKRSGGQSNFKIYLIAGTFLLLATVLCVLGGMFLSRSHSREKNKDCSVDLKIQCAYSTEAKRVELPEFLAKVKKVYYELHPDSLAWEPDIDDEQLADNVKNRYLPYDTHPLKLKEKTDKSLSLLAELNKKIIDIDKLKPAELKAVEQLKHFLQHNFGVVYDEHYYNGDWMMGPNYFCWQPFCDIHLQLYWYSRAPPLSYEELESAVDRIMKHKTAIDQYRKNIELGVKTGMVRSIEDCRSGVDALKQKSKHISQTNNSENIIKEWYTSEFQTNTFFQNIPSQDLELWVRKKNKTALESVKEALIKGFGEPMLDLIHYLEYEHVRHCPPSNVSSGLMSLPLDFIYFNGKATKQRTTKVLPTGERLNGRESYNRILSFFTTTNISVEEIYEKGRKQKELFYEEIVDVAKLIVNTSNISEAVTELRMFLNLDFQWHNEQEFPENESNAIAFKKCVDEESARIFCPVRYEAMEKWKTACREIMSFIHPQFIDAFHVTGNRVTLPNCPIEIYSHFNPSVGAMYFEESDEYCSEATAFKLPFFLERYGPKFQEWSVVAHETRPGHHSQAQGLEEYFHNHCGGDMAWLDTQNVFPALTEGWALYSENPVMSDDTEIYSHNSLQKYGMLKWQIWRALRLIIDTGLHHRGMKRGEAASLFQDYAWDNTDFAVKELTRYQSCPGQATSYMLGRLTIVELRRKAEQELGDMFDLKDFHYHVLSQGNSPLSFIQKYIEKYIECIKNNSSTSFCETIVHSQNVREEFNGGYQRNNKKSIFSRPRARHYP